MNQLAFTNSTHQSPFSADSFASSTAAFPAPTASSAPGQSHLYAANQAFGSLSGPDGGDFGFAGGAQRLDQQQQQQQQQHQPYAGSAGRGVYNQAHAFSPDPSRLQAQAFAQRPSPNVGDEHQTPKPFTNSSTPSAHFPMAAPSLPTSPANAQPPNNAAAPTPSTPLSPTAPSSLDQQRVHLLLEINQEILTEIHRLQVEDKGGAMSMQQAMQLKQSGQADKMASEEYVQLLRRLQGNLAYLMPRTGQQMNPENRILPGPAFMQHPPQMPQLADKYEKLRELFPEWPGNDAKLMAMSAAGGGGGAGSPTVYQQRQMQSLPPQQQRQQQGNVNGAMQPGNHMAQ